MKKYDYNSRKTLLLYISWLKALRDWFHSAHHVSSGASFSGDHVDLFGRIYKEIEEEIDGAIEKVLGLTEDTRLACPILTNKTSLTILEHYQSPSYDSQEEIVKNALNLEKDYVMFLEQAFKSLEKNQMLSLGLNDQLASSANTHETYLYLLKRRNEGVNTMLSESFNSSSNKYNRTISQAALNIVNNYDFEKAYLNIQDIWQDATYFEYTKKVKIDFDIDINDVALSVLSGTPHKGSYLAGSGGISFDVADKILILLQDIKPNVNEDELEKETYDLIKKFVKFCENNIQDVTYNNPNFDT